jgi:hypothetical protein
VQETGSVTSGRSNDDQRIAGPSLVHNTHKISFPEGISQKKIEDTQRHETRRKQT